MRAWFAMFVLLAACDDGGGSSAIDVQLVDPTGENAAAGLDGTLTIEVRQNDRILSCDEGACDSVIADGEFDLAFPIESLTEMTWAHATIEHDAGTKIGATPAFQPFGEGVDVIGFLRIVMAPPSGCHVLTLEGAVTEGTPHLSPARAHGAAVVRRNLVLFAGGDAGDAVDRYDLLTNDADPLPSWTAERERRMNEGLAAPAIGPARGIAISEDVSLVVGDESTWLFTRDPQSAPSITELGTIHTGASSRSVLLSIGDGAVVIGGDATRAITWFNASAVPFATNLAVPRTAPAASRYTDAILVVGGHADGEAAIEWVREQGGGTALVSNGAELPLSSGGVLFPSPDRSAALYIAFEVGGVTSTQTFVLRDCGWESCAVDPLGPTWDRARADVSALITAAGTLWLVGGVDDAGMPSRLTDIVSWDGSTPRIAEGPLLAEPRAGATLVENASGTIVVAGGLGIDGMREDLEMCFPAGLDPLL